MIPIHHTDKKNPQKLLHIWLIQRRWQKLIYGRCQKMRSVHFKTNWRIITSLKTANCPDTRRSRVSPLKTFGIRPYVATNELCLIVTEETEEQPGGWDPPETTAWRHGGVSLADSDRSHRWQSAAWSVCCLHDWWQCGCFVSGCHYWPSPLRLWGLPQPAAPVPLCVNTDLEPWGLKGRPVSVNLDPLRILYGLKLAVKVKMSPASTRYKHIMNTLLVCL